MGMAEPWLKRSGQGGTPPLPWTQAPLTLQGGREYQRPHPNEAMVPLEAVFCPCCGAALLHSLVLQQNLPQWCGRLRLGRPGTTGVFAGVPKGESPRQVSKALDQAAGPDGCETTSKQSPT